MNLLQELVGLVCSFSDSPTLASICLTNKAFYLDARAALYLDLTVSGADSVDRFLLCARDRLNLVKHLSLCIPSFPAHELEVWKRFLAAIRQDSDLITLRITSPPTHTVTFPGIQDLAGDLLSMPSLKYVAAATSVVSTPTVIQCPALRELEIRQSEDLEKLDDKELDKCIHGERQRLNTLILGGYNRSPRLLDNLFNLNDLKRLALAFPSKIITTTCRTLTELAIWVHRNAAETYLTAYLTEFRQIALPNLQAFILFYNGGAGIDQSWEACDSLVSTVIAVSGAQLREFRLYLHRGHPSTILNGERSLIPCFHPRITVLRLYCYDSQPPSPRAAEAETILRERMGDGRDFQVVWSINWTALTCFGVPWEL